MTFDEFAARHLPALLRYAAVLAGDRDLAQDIVQEVLARVHVRWSSISRLEVPEQYVRRMVTNEFLVAAPVGPRGSGRPGGGGAGPGSPARHRHRARGA